MDEDSQGAVSDEDSKLSSVPPQETTEGARSSGDDTDSDLENSVLSQRKSAVQRSAKKKPTWSSEDDSGTLESLCFILSVGTIKIFVLNTFDSRFLQSG